MQRLNTLLHPYTYTSILLCFGKMYVKKPCDLACKHLKSKGLLLLQRSSDLPRIFQRLCEFVWVEITLPPPFPAALASGPSTRESRGPWGCRCRGTRGPARSRPWPCRSPPRRGPVGHAVWHGGGASSVAVFSWLKKQAYASGDAAARLAFSPGRQPTQTPEGPGITGFWDRFPEHCEYVIRQTCRLGAGALHAPSD